MQIYNKLWSLIQTCKTKLPIEGRVVIFCDVQFEKSMLTVTNIYVSKIERELFLQGLLSDENVLLIQLKFNKSKLELNNRSDFNEFILKCYQNFTILLDNKATRTLFPCY